MASDSHLPPAHPGSHSQLPATHMPASEQSAVEAQLETDMGEYDNDDGDGDSDPDDANGGSSDGACGAANRNCGVDGTDTNTLSSHARIFSLPLPGRNTHLHIVHFF